MLEDIQKIGLWSGESSLNDQSLFYYMQTYQIRLEPWECDAIKECSRAYVNSYRNCNNEVVSRPYAPERTQEEVDAKDDRLLLARKNRG